MTEKTDNTLSSVKNTSAADKIAEAKRLAEMHPSPVPVRISLHSKMIALTADDIEDETFDRLLDSALPGLSADGAEDDFEELDYITDGIIVNSDNYVEVSYEESESMGLAGVKTSLVWYKSSPEVVTMVRIGTLNSGFVFSTVEKRQICTYDTGIIPIEFVICTRRLQNTIDPDGICGRLYIDYIIEFRGMKTERNLLTLDISGKSTAGETIGGKMLAEAEMAARIANVENEIDSGELKNGKKCKNSRKCKKSENCECDNSDSEAEKKDKRKRIKSGS